MWKFIIRKWITKSVSIHYENVHVLARKICKTINDLAPLIINTVTFPSCRASTIRYGSDSLTYLCSKIWDFSFFYLGFLSRTFTIHRTAGEGEAISLTPLYHFHLLHRHLVIIRAMTAVSSPLNIGSCRTRTGNLWFLSACCLPLSYVPDIWDIIPEYIKNQDF